MRTTTWMAALGLLILGALVGSTGCGGGGNSGVLIEGVVVGEDGTPRALYVVLIDGRAHATDALGRFTARGVRPPYDAVVFSERGPGATIYVGLRHRTPQLIVMQETPMHRADISGNLAGGVNYPLPAGFFSNATAIGPRQLSAGVSASFTTGFYDSTGNATGPTYVGDSSVDAVIVALQWSEDVTGRVNSYTGFGTDFHLLRAGDTATVDNIVFAPVSTRNLSGNYTLPAGLPLQRILAKMHFSQLLTMFVPDAQFADTGSFTMRVPQMPIDRYIVRVAAGDNAEFSRGRVTAAADATGLQLDLMDIDAVQVSPAAGATDIRYDTLFEWTPSPLGMYRFILNPYVVVTDRTDGQVLDLRDYGVELTPLQSNAWTVEAFGPHDSIDDLVDVGRMFPDGTTYHTRAQPRPFTVSATP